MKRITQHESKSTQYTRLTKGDPDAPYRRARSQPIGATAVSDELSRLLGGVYVTFSIMNPKTSVKAKDLGFFGVRFDIIAAIDGHTVSIHKTFSNEVLRTFDGTPETFAKLIYDDISPLLTKKWSEASKDARVSEEVC